MDTFSLLIRVHFPNLIHLFVIIRYHRQAWCQQTRLRGHMAPALMGLAHMARGHMARGHMAQGHMALMAQAFMAPAFRFSPRCSTEPGFQIQNNTGNTPAVLK